MYVDEQGGSAGAAGQFTIDPAQLEDFRAAVEQVRADLNKISRDVDAMSVPGAIPMLGSSPVGEAMAEKFTDRLTSEFGLASQLRTALTRMEQFISSAELTVASYTQTDADHATDMRYS
jgi:hypothetical protein